MSELVDRAKASLSDHHWAKSCRVESLYPERIMSQLIAEVERLEGESAHWKALWQGTIEDSTKVILERDEALRELEREQESHQETAEIMRRTRERAERLQAEIDAMKKQTSVSCCTLSYEEGFSQYLSCQGKLR
ncbi:hypothetical protein [Mycobacteroides abscessus]|uniref:hypothetical protein n=1 Tax=Mycobacteroides abscessus TaxID=36809 RepID=UPI00078CF3D2|nr:hypothetical protein [Mycobacteroides abscessus]AMU20849.1 hypothetical protein A3N95_08555 [Mycobacteroides abscessus]